MSNNKVTGTKPRLQLYLDLSRLVGDWHELYHSNNLPNQFDIITRFGPDPLNSNRLTFTKLKLNSQGREEVIKKGFIVKDNPSDPTSGTKLSTSLLCINVQVPYQILRTDYQNYAIIYYPNSICCGLANMDFYWIFVRNRQVLQNTHLIDQIFTIIEVETGKRRNDFVLSK